ncbi:hypothetical protein ACA910_015875 [Epithemia clementina (nom. ined.)]
MTNIELLFAKIAVGFYAGVGWNSKVQSNPLEPEPNDGNYTRINCDACHFFESDVSLVAKDPFLEYKLLLDQKPTEDLMSISYTGGLLKLCLMEDPNSAVCGNKIPDGEHCPRGLDIDCKSGACGYEFASTTVEEGPHCCLSGEKASVSGYDYMICTGSKNGQACSSNSDCSSEFCDGGLCVENKSCDTANDECCGDDDCHSPYPFCSDQICVCEIKQNVECCSNDDCEIACVNNKCTCTVDTTVGIDCCVESDCPANNLCVLFHCEPKCDDTSDIFGNSNSIGKCCNSNADCAGESVVCSGRVCTDLCFDSNCGSGGERCFFGSCICDGVGQCCSNEDCTQWLGDQWLGDRCINNKCRSCEPFVDGAECCVDSDCGDDLYYQCENKKCVERNCESSDTMCCSDSDCLMAFQVCEARVCVQKGNPRLTLTWSGEDGLDLHVITPLGSHIWWWEPLDPLSSGLWERDYFYLVQWRYVINIKFPMDGSAPKGTYTYWVNNYDYNGDRDEWTVSVWAGNDIQERHTGVGSSELLYFTV